MKVTFLGQGFTPNTDGSVSTYIEKFFSENKYHSFIGISAFASEAGIYGLSNCILSTDTLKNINLIVGIDQEGTPKEALEEILNLNINSYIFYQKEAPIFHPKIYLFEGDSKTSLIIGSSNLTARGLFNNVESSLLIEFDNDDAEGKVLLRDVKKYYSTLFDFSDQNLFEITHETIQKFIELGVVPSRRVWLKKQGKRKTSNQSNEDDFSIPPRQSSFIPPIFRKKPKIKELIENTIDEIESENIPAIETQNLVEVWKSKPLTERDLNIPSGDNTNPTGSMLLKKGLLPDNIDHRHYFRDEIFGHLHWEKGIDSKNHLEKTRAFFKIIIEGIDNGEFRLIIGHNTRTDIATYIQKNAMSQLHWGNAKSIVAKSELLGKTLTLFKDTNSEDQFTIQIE